MGHELLRSNAVFRSRIQSLDRYLQTLGAPWSIAEEMTKSASKSRVNDAEFSQPLCTALQIALVDAFSAVGVKAGAVVGHSSGEIAAAYAAGVLTASEAIAAAYYRGTSSKAQTKVGAMAAVSLSWDEARQYLIPGVVIACNNAHNNVTLSGDADKLQVVVEFIKHAKPGVLATTLKVEKAYHSHHMAEIGEAYYSAMASKVTGGPPSTPFYSSVIGALLRPSKGGLDLGPRYWQRNLQSPVLFRGAVSAILDDADISNPLFLEIGPHSALSGPLRQILTQASSAAPYVAAMVRRQDGVKGFLSAAGKLYTLHVPLNFEMLIPEGFCVPGLPQYPWNHRQSY